MFSKHIPLQAFTEEEKVLLPRLLARKIGSLGGISKLEEEHWTEVYCEAKGLPSQGFSNIFGNDVLLPDGTPVEMKCIRVKSITGDRWIMHPSLTRRIPEWNPDIAAEVNMNMIVNAYNSLIRQTFPLGNARWGVLLYLEDFSRFVYFETPIQVLDPGDLRAEYHSQIVTAKSRRQTTNLWIYCNDQKIMSVTSPLAGMKIQPYFYVPDACSFRYDIDIQNCLIPIEAGIKQLLLEKAKQRNCTTRELIESLLSAELHENEELTDDDSISFELIRRLGGIGSDWKSQLVTLLVRG